MASSSFLNMNDDMLTEILSYLSLEEVTRLKSVCKSWHRLISDNPHFQSLHLHRSSSRHVLGFFHKSAWKPGPIYLALHPDNPIPVQSSSSSSFFTNYGSMYSVLAVSNGLVLVADSKLDFYHVCNPSTDTLIKTIPSLLFAYEKRDSIYYGLATSTFSSSSSESGGGSFKIVSIFINSFYPKAYVSVYSSATDSSTRFPIQSEILMPTSLGYFNSDNPMRRRSIIGIIHADPSWKMSSALNPDGAASAKGCLHWLIEGGMIIAVPLKKQAVRTMNLPDGVSIERLGGAYRNVWFGSADNRLYLVFVLPGNLLLQLWILEDYENVTWKLVLEITDSTVVGGAPVYFDGRRIGIAALGEWEVMESKRPIRFFDTHTRKWGGSYNLPSDSHACQSFFPYRLHN